MVMESCCLTRGHSPLYKNAEIEEKLDIGVPKGQFGQS